MRIMRLDTDSRTVSVAISNPLGFTARGVEIIGIDEEADEFGLERFKKLAKQYKADKFVVGLPKNTNNTEGPHVEVSKAYGNKINELFNILVDYQDERLTTVQAERILVEQADVNRGKCRKVIDKLAAQLVLQNYLDKMF